MSERLRLRGYISSRSFQGERVPQSVQNLVVRHHCQRIGAQFLLSATEYAMPGCYLMLEQVLDELDSVDGVVAYSLFQMPADTGRRRMVFDRVMGAGRLLHFALEGMVVAEDSDVARTEDLWLVRAFVDRQPTARMMNSVTPEAMMPAFASLTTSF